MRHLNPLRKSAAIILVLIPLLGQQVWAQIPNIPLPKYQYDSSYIVKFDNLLALRLVSPRRLYDFTLKNTDSNDKVGYRPNLQSAFGLGVSYRWLAFDVVFNPKWNRKKTDKYGKTDEFNIKATLYLERHLLDLVYRRYKGMHIINPESYLDPWDGMIPYRPDMINNNLSINYTIPFNYKKYSLKTSFLVDGRMKQSAGSFMYTVAFHLSSMKADSSIIPTEYEYAFDQYARISTYGFGLLQQAFGYGYTFIYRKFYLTLSAMPGLSLAVGSVESDGGRYSVSSADFMFASRNGVGYNSRRWYTGLYFIYKYQDINLRDDLQLTSNLGEWRFFIGYRIHAPYIVNSIIKN